MKEAVKVLFICKEIDLEGIDKFYHKFTGENMGVVKGQGDFYIYNEKVA